MNYQINNITVKTSTRGVTGYNGSTFSPSWTLNADKPFIAACGNPSEAHLVRLLKAPDSTALHLGHYADSREAAYVVALYRNDPESVLTDIQAGTFNPVFPAELYDLPVTLTKEDAINLHIEYKQKSSAKDKKAAQVVINNKLVKDSISFITKSYGNKIFMELAKKFGRDVVINDREVLTINEFELRYGLSK